MVDFYTSDKKVVNVSRFFIGVVDDNYPLKAYASEKNRLMFNLRLELTGEGISEERYQYHKNQYTTGEWIVEYDKPNEDGWRLVRFRQLPPEILIPQHKLATLLFGTTTQLDPLKFGLTHVNAFTRSILINFT